MKILATYFTRLCVAPFLAVLGIMFSLFVFRQIYELIPLIEGVNLKLQHLFWLIALNSLPTVSLLAPISFAIAVYFTTNTASSHSELIGMQSLGISLKKLLNVVVLFSIALSIILAFINLIANPASIYQAIKFQQNLTNQFSKVNINPQSVNSLANNLIYFDQKDGANLKNMLIYLKSNDTNLIYAKNAKLDNNSASGNLELKLESGAFLISADNGKFKQIHNFEEATIPIEFNVESKVSSTVLKDENKWQDVEYLPKKPYSLLNLEDMRRLVFSPSVAEDDKRWTVMEFNSRLLQSLSVIAFAIYAFALGINNPRIPTKGNLLLLIAGIVLFFQFNTILRKIVDHQLVNPIIMYIPFIVLLLLGYTFFIFADNNRPIRLFNFNFSDAYHWFLKIFKKEKTI